MKKINEQDYYNYIGKQIQMSRMARNISQNDLAVMLGLKRTSLTNIESGKQRIQVYDLWRVSDILGFPLEHFLPHISEDE